MMSAAPVEILHECIPHVCWKIRASPDLGSFEFGVQSLLPLHSSPCSFTTAFAPAAVTGLTGAASVEAADDAACPLLVSKRDLLAEGWSGSLPPAMAPESLLYGLC